ncbi:hypothetical protein GCM10009636_09100 [Arthrobacter koreensis]
MRAVLSLYVRVACGFARKDWVLREGARRYLMQAKLRRAGETLQSFTVPWPGAVPGIPPRQPAAAAVRMQGLGRAGSPVRLGGKDCVDLFLGVVLSMLEHARGPVRL